VLLVGVTLKNQANEIVIDTIADIAPRLSA
jgi:hypothetical protein